MKRAISFALALTMVMSSMPNAFAEDISRDISSDDYVLLNPDQETVIIDSTKDLEVEEDIVENPEPTPQTPTTAQQYADLLNEVDEDDEPVYYLIRSEEDLRNIWTGQVRVTLAQLNNDITITQCIDIPPDVMANLDLNGHTINVDVKTSGTVFNLVDSDSREDSNLFPGYKSFGTIYNGKINIQNADTVFSQGWWNNCDYTVVGSCSYLYSSNEVNYNPITLVRVYDYSPSNFTVYKNLDSKISNVQVYINKSGGSFALAENLNVSISQITYLDLQASIPGVQVYLAYKNAAPGVEVDKLGIYTTNPVTADVMLADKLSTNFTHVYFDRNLAEYVGHMKGTANSCDNPSQISIEYNTLTANWKTPFENIDGVNYTSNQSVVMDPINFEVEYNSETKLPMTFPQDGSQVTINPPSAYPDGTVVDISGNYPNYQIIFKLTDYTKSTGSFSIPYTYTTTFYAPRLMGASLIGWDYASETVTDSVLVTWQLTKLPVLGITVVQPNTVDGVANVDWGADPLVWKANLTPEGAVGDITVTSSNSNVIAVDGSELIVKDVGSASLTFECEGLTEQITLNVNATDEYNWIQEVESIKPPITLDNQQQLNRLEADASALDMSKIPESTWNKFQGYLQDLQDLLNNAPYLVVERMIQALPQPEQIKFAHAGQVDAAAQAYNSLTSEHQSMVKPALVTKLQECVKRIEDLRKQMVEAQAIIDAIDSLPSPEDIKMDHASAVQEIYEALQAFDDNFKDSTDLIPKEYRDKLSSCLSRVEKLYAAVETARLWAERVNRLPDPSAITDSNYTSVEPDVIQLRTEHTSFDSLTRDEIAAVYPSALKKLSDLESAISAKYEEGYKRIAESFNQKVLAVDISSINSDFKDTYLGYMDEYNSMTSEVKKYVTQEVLNHLKKIKQKLDEYQLSIDRSAAQTVIDQIKQLPEVSEITLDYENAVADVEASYNALTPEQKALVSNYDKLKTLRKELDNLAAIKKEVDAFIDKVTALPDNEHLEPKDFSQVKELYIQFTEMSNSHLKLLNKTETPSKLVQLYSHMLKMLDCTVYNELYDFTLRGLVANPDTAKLDVTIPVSVDAELYTKYRNELEKDSGKDLIAFYHMNLTGGKPTSSSDSGCDPWDTIQIRFPVPSVYSNQTDVGLVLFDPNKSGNDRIQYVQPEIKDIGGKLYFVYNANTTQYVGVVAKSKSFSWVFSFFGKRSIVSLNPSMLDSTYSITEFKTNPLMDNG